MSRSLRVAVQMDPIESINIDGDSTFALMLEAQARGHRLWHYHVRDLALRGGRVTAWAKPIEVRREHGRHFTLGAEEELDLGEGADVVLMRQDPPFDMAYITATHILEHIHPRTLVVNDPAQVRNAPEKLFVTHFPELMPVTMVTADRRRIAQFRSEHGDIIIKPLFGNGGAGVFHLRPDDPNMNSLVEMFTERSREPLMIQKYVPAVREGDKRIILVDGVAMGAINRVPAAGEARSNMHVGGRPEPTTLTDREREICAAIGPELKKRGMIFVGIDVIGGYLTEINVTSPTGLQEIARFDGVHLERAIWDAIEGKVGGR
ncbi:glutathione synthase [Roseomonas sp. PWR1]|uniref:Glutathione synthetase n=1 Tax=Roseomonas nitratireducens TaxID=2820810 RepID=A0ABS4AMC8_9PROT|nr:glutathione synthase [Neoroseomonas nitratireducens]MBP0462505.1 glutathione synthase [Neoroseomonas nitratireducens]